jgi:DNA-binding XRE family transcriptional regulator
MISPEQIVDLEAEQEMPLCPACGEKVVRLPVTDPEVAPHGLCVNRHIVPLKPEAAPAPPPQPLPPPKPTPPVSVGELDLDDKAFGLLVRAERKAAHLNQGQLAKMAGITAQTVSNIERGYKGASRPLRELLLIKVREQKQRG